MQQTYGENELTLGEKILLKKHTHFCHYFSKKHKAEMFVAD